jgi:hypothetical protein
VTRDQLIETMARALEPDAWWNADGPLADVADVIRRPSINAATAALTAIEAAGMRVVPVEPTERMIRVGGERVDYPSVYMGGPSHHAKRLAPAVYRAMVLAAQENSTSE